MGADLEPLEISAEMIEAGVSRLREMEFGLPFSEIVSDIYAAMETARRYKSIASRTNPSK